MTQRQSLFDPNNDSGKVLAAWWRGLAGDRGARAELRRARSPDHAALVPATIDLVVRLRATPVSEHKGWLPRVPPIAGIAAHLDPNAEARVLSAPSSSALPKQMAETVGARPRVSELRFRRLLRCSRDELYRPMIRVLAQLDGRASVFDVANAVFWWGPQIQKAWAFAYFPALHRST